MESSSSSALVADGVALEEVTSDVTVTVRVAATVVSSMASESLVCEALETVGETVTVTVLFAFEVVEVAETDPEAAGDT